MDDRIDLDTHIQDILGVLQCEELSDVVLCGHSYGGMVISGVADKASEKISSMVYLDALLPADGQNVFDLLPDEAASGFKEDARTRGPIYRIAPTPSKAFGVNAEDQAWVNRRSVDHPLKTFEQPIRLEGRWKQVRRRVYIYATGWSPGVGRPFFEQAQNETTWQAISLPCGHYVMIEMPEELTQLLIASVGL